ncbi:MAG: hypothetical protein ACRDHD_05470, partial [Candidatus Limnocylindria bacterium]
MKRPRRIAAFVAIVAALMMAPSSASAAQPGALLDPWVAPRTGTVSTVFAFRVRYVSATGRAATAVTAAAGPASVSLVLVAGTATDGTWSGAGLLTAGTWEVQYRASVAKGPPAKLTGPTVVVAPLPSPTPQSSAPALVPPAGPGGPTAPSSAAAPTDEAPPSADADPAADAT